MTQERQKKSYSWAVSLPHCDRQFTNISYCDTISKRGVAVSHDIYTPQEKAESPDKDNTNLLFFPGERGKPFMLVCAGGGYATVCSFLEGYPVAAALS